VQTESQKQLQQCRFLLCQALDADEAGNKDEAVELYTQAVDLGIRAVSIHTERVVVCPLIQLQMSAYSDLTRFEVVMTADIMIWSSGL
jgi:hypothetical protein